MRSLILILLYVLKRALDVDHDFFIYSLLKPCPLFHLTIKSIDLRAYASHLPHKLSLVR